MANVRKNINSMETLQSDNGHAIPSALMSDYLRSHFKGILGTKIQHLRPFDLSSRVGPVLTDQLQSLDNIIDEAEILRAISGMPYGKASGPNNFPIEFYQAFWATIKFDLIELIREFVKNNVNIRCINKAAITLIPNKQNLERISDYRPISVINTVTKIITKIMANRLQPHLQLLISNSLTDFVQGRSLMESFLSAREFLNFCFKRKLPYILYKIDFEKAFDMVD